jgi:hypothetical protein
MCVFGSQSIEMLKARHTVQGKIRALKWKHDLTVPFDTARGLDEVGGVRAMAALQALARSGFDRLNSVYRPIQESI